MFEYEKEFADVYNEHWTAFARHLAPLLLAWHETRISAAGASGRRRRILDVCCGTGQLLLYFLEHGYTGTGIDISPWMLGHAKENCRTFASEGKADFLLADAADFTLGSRHDLAVSTFDALNHLESLPKLQSCFRCVRVALDPGGVFFFDLNTRKGLQRWNHITVEDTDRFVLINRGLFAPGMDRAYARITGFTRDPGGSWSRFEETAINTVFAMADVQQALTAAGFAESWFVAASDPDRRITDPEEQDRAYIVAVV